jgi:hypothetical protein
MTKTWHFFLSKKRLNDERPYTKHTKSHPRPPRSTGLWAVDDHDDEQSISSSMPSTSVAPPSRPRLVPNRSGLSDSSTTQESGSSHAFSSPRHSGLPTGHRVPATVASPAPPELREPVDPARGSVASKHCQGRQALDLTRDKPLPDIPASSTITQPVRRSCLILAFSLGAAG